VGYGYCFGYYGCEGDVVGDYVVGGE